MNKHLKEALEVASEVEDINCGGCGLAALAVSRYLKKMGVKSPIKFIYLHNGFFGCDPQHLKNNKNYVKNKKNNNNSNNDGLCVPSHIVINYRGKYYDSDGVYTDFDPNHTKKYVVVDDERDLLQTLNKPKLNGWNTHFWRNGAVEHLADNLEIDLSDVALKWENHNYI